MSTLRQLGIEYAKITEISGEPVERVIHEADDEYEEEREIEVTLKVKLFTKADLKTLQQMTTAPYTGAVELYTSR